MQITFPILWNAKKLSKTPTSLLRSNLLQREALKSIIYDQEITARNIYLHCIEEILWKSQTKGIWGYIQKEAFQFPLRSTFSFSL